LYAGILDEKTLEWMNKPRCGVPDREYHAPSASTHPPTRRKRFSVEGIHFKLTVYNPSFFKNAIQIETVGRKST
jgi:hypothetical protein